MYSRFLVERQKIQNLESRNSISTISATYQGPPIGITSPIRAFRPPFSFFYTYQSDRTTFHNVCLGCQRTCFLCFAASAEKSLFFRSAASSRTTQPTTTQRGDARRGSPNPQSPSSWLLFARNTVKTSRHRPEKLTQSRRFSGTRPWPSASSTASPTRGQSPRRRTPPTPRRSTSTSSN